MSAVPYHTHTFPTATMEEIEAGNSDEVPISPFGLNVALVPLLESRASSIRAALELEGASAEEIAAGEDNVKPVTSSGLKLGQDSYNGADPYTVSIPTNYSTLQEAVDAVGKIKTKPGQQIVIMIESGHALTAGLTVANGDYSHIVIRSVDATVPLATGFSGAVITGRNAAMPVLDCLIDAANQVSSNGVQAYDASRMHIPAGRGVINAYGTGLQVRYGSNVSANGTVWAGAARNGTTGAGITAWGAHVDAEAADVSNSGYYGAQAAHGGVLCFNKGKANNCARYGVRGTDAGVLDFSEGQANNCGVYGIYAFRNSQVNAPESSAINCGSHNAVALNGSTLDVRTAILTGAVEAGLYVRGSIADASSATLDNAGTYGIDAGGAAAVQASSSSAKNCVRGYYACEAATITAGASNATGSGTGFYAETGGTINADTSTATGCTSRGALATTGGTVNVNNATLTGATTTGIRATQGGIINANSANCQKGGSASSTDIEVANGSTINATGATGGLSQTANLQTASGVIYSDAGVSFPEFASFTPSISFITPGDLAVTYSTQIGRYIRIGRLCIVSLNIQTSAFTHSTASGSFIVNGLPFAPTNVANLFWNGPASVGGITLANYTDFEAEIDSTSSRITIRASGSGQAPTLVTSANMASGGTVRLKCTVIYWTA